MTAATSNVIKKTVCINLTASDVRTVFIVVVEKQVEKDQTEREDIRWGMNGSRAVSCSIQLVYAIKKLRRHEMPCTFTVNR